MTSYYLEPRTRKYVKVYGFLSFRRNLANKYRRRLLDTVAKTGLDAQKSVTKKAAEAAGEFIENEITNKIVKPKPVPDENLRNVEVIKKIK